MKKTYIVCILLTLLVLGAGIGAFVIIGDAVEEAEAAQLSIYAQYLQMQQNALQTDLTVTEEGTIVGTYSLEQLGVLQDTQAAIESCFGPLERMEPTVFANLTVREKLDWEQQSHQSSRNVAVDLSQLDFDVVLQDLNAMPRYASENAYVEFDTDAFLVYDEIYGTQLLEDTVLTALMQVVAPMTVTDGVGSAEHVFFELTDTACYVLPEITVENAQFDLDSMLREKIQGMSVTVDFHGKTETLSADDLSALLSVSPQGIVQADQTALQQIIAVWAAMYKETDVSYLLDSYVSGPRPIRFLTVDYDIDQEALLTQLCQDLVYLQPITLDAPWLCFKGDEPFSLGDTYVEVDMDNQVMTYYKDGDVLVTTDVVTGAAWGYMTPDGLYKVENKDTECWLTGPDYNVFVDYWVGFIGYTYGLHDADWRTKFGGDVYVKNGSHGCVNTPKEAMAVIFENIEPGVPVLVYGDNYVI